MVGQDKLEGRVEEEVRAIDTSNGWRDHAKRFIPSRLMDTYKELGRDFLKAYIVYDVSYRLICAAIAASVTGKLGAAIPALYAPGVTTTGVPAAAAYTTWRSRRRNKVREVGTNQADVELTE